jgi:hypothetical protein
LCQSFFQIDGITYHPTTRVGAWLFEAANVNKYAGPCTRWGAIKTVLCRARVRPAFLSPAALDANNIFKNQSAIFEPNGIAGMFSAVDEDCNS